MKTLRFERHDSTARIELDKGVINAINLEMVKELSRAVEEVRNDETLHGLVITSSNEKFFSIGFDIPELFPLEREGFVEFFSAFNALSLDLFTLPKPSFAALTGHAVAGGCVLALCCDYRIMAEGKKMIGLNEIKLGVPVPYLSHGILRSVVGERFARDVVETGGFFGPRESLDMGLVDQGVPVEQVVPEATERCEKLGSMPPMAYALMKRVRTDPVANDYRACEAEQEKLFCDCWYSEPARACIAKAMETFKK